MTHRLPPIGPYERKPASVLAWDPRSMAVAEAVTELIRVRRPDLVVEHIGSTSVPNSISFGKTNMPNNPAMVPKLTRTIDRLMKCEV